jgi:hypothetical protein
MKIVTSEVIAYFGVSRQTLNVVGGVNALWFALISLLEILGSILLIDHFEIEIRSRKKLIYATDKALNVL